ncbi:MAG: response regulator [Coriobacteriales bacterium]|jgi:signal transduction histidine kinase|nr:response regulator [Coriobacteriales bacterium]
MFEKRDATEQGELDSLSQEEAIALAKELSAAVERQASELKENQKESKRLAREVRHLKTEIDQERSISIAKANQKILETQVQRERDRYLQLLLASSQNIILMLDKQLHIAYCTATFIATIGARSEDEVIGRSLHEVIQGILEPEFMQIIDTGIDAAVETKSVKILHGQSRSKLTGTINRYSINVSPMFGSDEASAGILSEEAKVSTTTNPSWSVRAKGTPEQPGTQTDLVFEGVLLLFNDITELELAREHAEQASRAKGDFLSNMSHEMRTPMNAIMGMTAIGSKAQTIEKKDLAFSKIDTASRHLLGVINDILDMSKIEAKKFELSSAEFNVKELLQRIVDVNAFKINENAQLFEVRLDEDLPPLLVGDDQRFSQVITNLLSNAIKFTPEGGSITLTLAVEEQSDTSCTFLTSISDTGIGISEEQQSRLFHSFEQAESSTSRKFGGTGLGLAISKNIVELMGGRIWVESEPGKGSTFSFSTTMEIPDEEHEMASSTDVPSDSDNHDFSGYHLLLAEDVDINREILHALLEPTDIAIDDAENGVAVVERFKEHPERYDVIFMDVQMPVMDGLEATRTIRALGLPQAERIPIIAMTANVFREDIEKCLAAGMNDHLGKPIDLDLVLRKLNEYLPL